MKSRFVATAVLTSLIASLPAAADRRSKRRIVAETEEDDDQDGPEAKSALTVKLDDLIEVAVRLSPALARSKNDRLVARGQAEASRLNQEWAVTTQAQVERFAVGPEVQVGAFQVVAENKLLASLGFGRNLPTGGNFGLEISVQRSNKEFEIPSGLGKLLSKKGSGDQTLAQLAQQAEDQATQAQLDNGVNIVDETTVHQAQAKITFKQPLARGFGSDVALADQKKADLGAAQATIKTQFEAEQLVRDVVTAYWQLAYASYEVDRRAEALEFAREQEKITGALTRSGTNPKTDLDSARYEIALREEALLTAKNEYEKASLDLRKTVGLELDRRDIVLRPVDKFEIEPSDWDIAEVLKAARRGNRQIAQLILEKRAADVDVKVAKNAMAPKVDLSVSGAVFGSGNTPDAALAATGGGAGFQVTGNLTVQFEIGGAAKGQHDAALAKRQRVEVDQADVQRTIDAEVVHAVHAVKSAQARVALAERAITVSTENVKAERLKFQNAVPGVDNFRVFQRQSELVEANLRRGKAVAEYHIAVAQLQFLGGMLLEQYRVAVRPLPKK